MEREAAMYPKILNINYTGFVYYASVIIAYILHGANTLMYSTQWWAIVASHTTHAVYALSQQ